jgi:hypothetical protein
VISKQKKIVDFLDELGLFIEEKPILRKKKSVALPSAAISWLSKIIFLSASLETSPFGSLKELV